MVLTSLLTGRFLGAAVLCPRASYATIHWAGSNRLDRIPIEPVLWIEIEREIASGLPATLLAASSPIMRALVGDAAPDIIGQYLAEVPAPAEGAEDALGFLDRIAWGRTNPPIPGETRG